MLVELVARRGVEHEVGRVAKLHTRQILEVTNTVTVRVSAPTRPTGWRVKQGRYQIVKFTIDRLIFQSIYVRSEFHCNILDSNAYTSGQ